VPSSLSITIVIYNATKGYVATAPELKALWPGPQQLARPVCLACCICPWRSPYQFRRARAADDECGTDVPKTSVNRAAHLLIPPLR
jgi:hypothetical protein